jgi:hypothetical protein
MSDATPELHAVSTVAVSAYNLVAVAGKPLKATEIRERLASSQHVGLSIERTREALNGLVGRKLMRLAGDEAFDVVDPKRRVVVGRDRSDAQVLDDGAVTGGWNGWRVRERATRSAVPIEEVLR